MFLQAKVDELESKAKNMQGDHLNAELSKKYQETLKLWRNKNNESIEKAKQKLEENVKAGRRSLKETA